ncbi:MAG: LptA/OstA family protein, partial [Chthoniobacterales bacterium]
VVVRDPQMTMTGDKLVITLNKNRKGMDKAECSGNVVLVHESQEKGKAAVKSIGRAQMAIYEPASGNLILMGSPQVQQGVNNHISTEPGTRMILNRDGRLSTIGGNKTIITDASQLDQTQGGNSAATPAPTSTPSQTIPLLR